MKCWRYSPSSASMICSSCPVPSVATHNAWVSPRVNSAEPCARGSTPTSATIGRTVLVSRPSMRSPVSRMALRTMSASSVLEGALGLLGVEALGGQGLGGGLLGRAHLLVADLLDLLLVGLGDRAAGQRVDAGGQRRLGLARLGQRPGLLRGAFGQFDDRLDHRLEMRVAEGDGAEHDVFRQLLRLRLDHQHALGRCRRPRGRACCPGHLLGGRVQHVLAVDVADAGGGRPGRRTGCRTASAPPSSRSSRRCRDRSPGHG